MKLAVGDVARDISASFPYLARCAASRASAVNTPAKERHRKRGLTPVVSVLSSIPSINTVISPSFTVRGQNYLFKFLKIISYFGFMNLFPLFNVR